ncbi:hypothetical protein BJ322DRAFT_1210890 [Thelephora terrestris]|uniref:Uncharacterized protein n=1 Tax=Thelephora terrestris TaxID=56493 RepID=A0A9P6L6K0_9AGAM|nr:hypothetical protein BJ322DRAFT_1210890 [Thelephora terrestris]
MAACEFGQAILNRQMSIKEPLYDRSFLPFWVLTLWERLAELNSAREKWTLAQTWLQKSSQFLAPAMSTTARQHFTRTGWGADITFGRERATTLTLPQLLADARLNGTVFDLMVEFIQTEVNDDGPAGPLRSRVGRLYSLETKSMLLESSSFPRKVAERTGDMSGSCLLQKSTACRASVSSFSGTPTSGCSVQFTRPMRSSRPSAMNLSQHASFLLSFREHRVHRWGLISKSARKMLFFAF